jgi:Cyclic nucleotide-binding domain
VVNVATTQAAKLKTVAVGAMGSPRQGSAVVTGEGDREQWVRPLGWAALAVWLGIPVLGLVEQDFAGRIVWTVAVASLPLFIVLIGYHRWRRICPLAFFNQIPVRLRRPGARRASAAFEEHYYYVPFAMFFVGLWLRLIWTNGDGIAIAMFFVLISLVALGVGVLFTGKTWCNYICPVSFIEKIYTEPRGLRDTQNSQCAKCTACKKACPDINQENGYWKEIDSPSKRFVYFAYPGLVFGFYFYYFAQSGTWDYYFDGTWTNEPGVILRAFLLGLDAKTAGFFFLPAVPRALAAALTLAICAAISLGVFWLAEKPVGRWLRRRDASVDVAQIRNVMFGLAAFTAFVTFYSFAGQPTLRKLPWLPAYTSVLVVLTASFFLLRRLTRTQQAFAEQSVARNIIKRWTWADSPPPANLHDAYVIHTARTTERERMYAGVLEVYQDAIREVLADGFVAREEVQRLEALRDQLQIKKADHERVMATLADEQRLLLTEPSRQASSEKRLQLQTYARAVERDLERVLATDDPVSDSFVQQLRREFAVTAEEHAGVLEQLLGTQEHTRAQVLAAIALIELTIRAAQTLNSHGSPNDDMLVYLLRRERARAVDRVLRVAQVTSDETTTHSISAGLCSDNPVLYSAAIQEIANQLPQRMREQLIASQSQVAREAAALSSPNDIFRACLDDADPFVRAVALHGLAVRGQFDPIVLAQLAYDDYPLVRETALVLLSRPQSPATGEGQQPMLTIEKMIALRSVPSFTSLGPEALEQLALSSREATYTAGQALCLEGERGDDVFVVLSGDVGIVRGTSSSGELIRVVSTGSVTGEMAVLEGAARSASAFARSEAVRVLRLGGSAFRSVLAADPAVAEGVIRMLAHRLRNREEVLVPS